MSGVFLCGRFELTLKRPLVMGIVNLTPDSFSDGGRYDQADAAIAHACTLKDAGADILDIGGESTRPGAAPVSVAEEKRRILPVLEALRDAGVPISIDTCKPAVMRAALAAGADMINDVCGFRQPEAIAAVAASRCGLCAMHMQGEPRTMQHAPAYQDVVAEVADFLAARARALRAAGVDARRIVLDPGLGFGKTAAQNYTLVRELAMLRIGIDAPSPPTPLPQAGEGSRAVLLPSPVNGRGAGGEGTAFYPLLLGLSRKSMIGHITGKPVDERLPGSLAGMLAGVARGASIVRVHDVAATVDALAVWRAVATGIHSNQTTS